MTRFAYRKATQPETPPLGLIVLETDETIESDFRRMLPWSIPLYVSRVPCAPQTTAKNLRQMAGHLTDAARLFPSPLQFDVVGYGCTSATAQIGAAEVARLVKNGAVTARVTDPLTALAAACQVLKISRLAFLSPYVRDVSDRLRQALEERGIASPVFGSFEESDEAAVVRISAESIFDAATALASQGGAQAIFLSCTNLRTMDVIERIEAATGLPCLSSNQVMAWDMTRGRDVATQIPGRLGRL